MKTELPARHQFRCIVPVEVQWGDMDAYNHVNNVIYFRYFETGRVKHLEMTGAADFTERSDGPVVAKLEMNYLRQVTYPARLDICTRASELRNRSYIMQCAMFEHGTDVLVAHGAGAIVWIDKASGKAIALPDDVRASIEDFERTA
jgi:acyl-CoA thioester hydrolase